MVQYLTIQGDINSLSVTDGSQPQASTATTPALGTTLGENSPPALSQPVAATGVQARALGNMRLRAQPNDNSARVGNLAWGDIIPVLGRSADGKWILVSANGVQGWSAREWYVRQCGHGFTSSY